MSADREVEQKYTLAEAGWRRREGVTSYQRPRPRLFLGMNRVEAIAVSYILTAVGFWGGVVFEVTRLL